MLRMAARPRTTPRRPPPQRTLHFREWREHFGLSQDGVAARIGTDKGTISRLESGRQRGTVAWAEKYAAALRINPIAFYRLPGTPSLDEMVAPLPDEQRDLITRMIEGIIRPTRN